MRFLLMLLVFLAAPVVVAEERAELVELLDAANDAFPKAIAPRRFEFPADHGPHPEYRNEWWYVTGNLDAESGRRFGYELTIFRFALTPTLEDSPSAWRTNQLFIAHLAVTDPGRERFYVDEKLSRGALGLAGAEAAPFAVWIDDWSIRADAAAPENWLISAASEDMALDLTLKSLKPPVLNGDAGLSQKSSEPGNASYYYSMTRLETVGELRVGDASFQVRGSSWADREWSTSALGDDQVGWDWFALQFEDGRELMVYQLRRRDGSADPNSAGTLVFADGGSVHLENDDIVLRVLDTWSSPEGGTYPSRWQLEVPAYDIRVEVVPVMQDQELFTTVRYWEGAVDVSGSSKGQDGRGYVELTGYAETLE
ncbi:MAG: lipocalin-like domain-containing protein [Woeseiaceae bacterium]|nr:lipocalin-like domain-containing protein [Woeseiaceae bacterium]